LHGPCGRLAGELMGSEEVCFLYDQYFEQRISSSQKGSAETAVSGAGIGAGSNRSRTGEGDVSSLTQLPSTPFHQDQPYWSVRGFDVATIWVPLDPIPKQLGVQYIAGSHAWGKEFIPRHFATGQEYNLTEDTTSSGGERATYASTDGSSRKRVAPQAQAMASLPSLDDLRSSKYEKLSWDMEPGDVLVFYGKVIHGQDPSSSTQTAPPLGQFRRLALRFTGDDARYCVRSGEAKDVIPSKFHPCGLKDGDRMRCDRFPRVWKRSP